MPPLEIPDIVQLLLSNETYSPDRDICFSIAELHNQGHINFFEIANESSFLSLDLVSFFRIQIAICLIIPELSGSAHDMMKFIRSLVQKGENDLCANRPYDAFRGWCERDLTRVDAVVSAATAGDQLAADHLSCALEVSNRFDDALSLLSKTNESTRLASISALNRMALPNVDAAMRLFSILRKIIESDHSELARAFAFETLMKLSSQYEINHEDIISVFEMACTYRDESMQFTLAKCLDAYGTELPTNCIGLAFKYFLSSNPKRKDILHIIDSALSSLLSCQHFDASISFLTTLVSEADGQIELETFRLTIVVLESSSPERFHRTIVHWLFISNTYICEGLSRRYGREGSAKAFHDFSIGGRNLSSYEAGFLARKSIGYFFMNPVIAVNIIVAILNNGSDNNKAQIAGYLFDPILINFGVTVRPYIDDIATRYPQDSSIKIALNLHDQYLKDLRAVGFIRELEPSESNRQIEVARMREMSRDIQKQAEDKSLFMNIMQRTTLLYGRSSYLFLNSEDNELRSKRIDMQEISFSIELPRFHTINPVGLSLMIFGFKKEEFKDEANHS